MLFSSSPFIHLLLPLLVSVSTFLHFLSSSHRVTHSPRLVRTPIPPESHSASTTARSDDVSRLFRRLRRDHAVRGQSRRRFDEEERQHEQPLTVRTSSRRHHHHQQQRRRRRRLRLRRRRRSSELRPPPGARAKARFDPSLRSIIIFFLSIFNSKVISIV